MQSLFRRFEHLIHLFPIEPPKTPPRTVIGFLWFAIRGMRLPIAVMALLSAIVGTFDVQLVGLVGKVVDYLSTGDPAHIWQQAGQHLTLLTAVLLASPLVVLLANLFRNQVLSVTLPTRLRWNFHRLMLAQSVSFYQNEFAGRVAAKVMQTSQAVRDSVMILADALLYAFVIFVTMIVMAIGLHSWLLLPFMVWLALSGLALAYFVPRLQLVAKSQADARSLLNGRIVDAYNNIVAIKLFSHSRQEANYAKTAMQECANSAYRERRLVSASDTLLFTLNAALILAVGAIALWLWSCGEIGVGAVAAALALAVRMYSMTHWVMWELAQLVEHIGIIQDGISSLCRPIKIQDLPGAPPLRVRQGEIRYDHVRFSYDTTRPVIDDLTLHVRAGEKVGVVGRSGGGKSSLFNLLLRFHDVNGGSITIDGQNIEAVSQDSLRAQIGLVTQDTSLLHRSIRDNIRYGHPGASESDIVRAARQAEAHEFILGMRDDQGRTGYDAHIGERGAKLSGGQRQRIAIARVLLKNAPILLLDEATSALDSAAEAAIQSNLYRLMKDKTVIAIAHRLSTIAAMDRLIVLDQGRIAEQGTHHALLARGGLYAQLWTQQSGSMAGEYLADDTA